MDMGGCYANSLAPEIAQRYQEKLQLFCDNVDPYSLDPTACSTSVADLPNVSGHSIRSYLLLSKCPYSGRAGDTAATPDEYSDPDQSGWVARTFVKKLDGIVIVLGELQILDTGEFLNPWFVAFPDGYVLCAHCTCAAGTNETCIHIGGLLHRVQQLRENVSPDDDDGGGDQVVVVKMEPSDDTSNARSALRRVRREIWRQQQQQQLLETTTTTSTVTSTAPVVVSLRRLNAVAASVAGRSHPPALTAMSTMSTAAATAAAINRSVAAAADAAPKPIVLNFSNGLRKINIVTARTVYETNVGGIPVTTTVKTQQPYQGSLRLIPATAGDARTRQVPLKMGATSILKPVVRSTAATTTTTTTPPALTNLTTPSTASPSTTASPRRRGKTRPIGPRRSHSSADTSPITAKRPARIKLYVCGICTAQFGDKDSFKQHCQENHALPLGGVAAPPPPPTLASFVAAAAATSTTPAAATVATPAAATVVTPACIARVAELAQSQLNNLSDLRPKTSMITILRKPQAPPKAPVAVAETITPACPSLLVTTPPSTVRKTARRQLVRLMQEKPATGRRLQSSSMDPLSKTAVSTATVKQEPDLEIEAEPAVANSSCEVMVEEYLTDEMNDDDDDDDASVKNGTDGKNTTQDHDDDDDDDDDDCIVIKQEPDLVIVDDDDDETDADDDKEADAS